MNGDFKPSVLVSAEGWGDSRLIGFGQKSTFGRTLVSLGILLNEPYDLLHLKDTHLSPLRHRLRRLRTCPRFSANKKKDVLIKCIFFS